MKLARDRRNKDMKMGAKYYAAARLEYGLREDLGSQLRVLDKTQPVHPLVAEAVKGVEAYPINFEPPVSSPRRRHHAQPKELRRTLEGHSEAQVLEQLRPDGSHPRGHALDQEGQLGHSLRQRARHLPPLLRRGLGATLGQPHQRWQDHR
eukprot:15432424-Alexandrium_andersonii.AAC.1